MIEPWLLRQVISYLTWAFWTTEKAAAKLQQPPA